MVATALSLLALEATALPAYAGKSATATISSDADCNSNQETTAVRVKLTDIPKWQKITVYTTTYPVTRDHDDWVRDGDSTTGTGYYNVPIEGDVKSVSAWISNNDWSGSFVVTGMSCRDVTPPAPATTAPTADPTTPPPTTEATTQPHETQPTTVPIFPGAPNPATTTNPDTPAGTTTPSPSSSVTTPASPTTPSSANPTASHTSAISPSAVAITSDEEDSLFGYTGENSVTKSIIQVANNPGEAAVAAWPWGVPFMILLGLAYIVRRMLKPRDRN